MNKNVSCNLFASSTQLLRNRLPWLLLIAALAWTSMTHAQIIGMEDLFSYTTSNINNHAPSITGTGLWGTYYDTGANISTNGTCALISTGSTGRASASYAFIPQANTLYTLNATVNFKPVGSNGCWQGVGFSNSSDDGNHSNNPAPWILIWGQTTGSSNSSTSAFTGNAGLWSGTVPAAYFSGPVQVTVTWNTSSNQATYSLNGVLQTTWATTAPTFGQTFYAWFEGASTRNYTSVKNVTLSAQAIAFSNIAMQDNFTYTSSSINNQTPTTVMGSGWSAKWTTWNSGTTAIISTSGSQAVINTNGGGAPGSGGVIADYPFNVSANTFYTLRGAFSYSLMGSSYDCWLGFGFNNSFTTNVAPWMLIRPQAVSTDNPGVGCNVNNSWFYSGNLAAANYSAPITATITWNTATGETKYYINDLLKATGTSAVLPNGQFYAFFQGFQTGTCVKVNTISLTAQPVSSLPEVWYAPQYDGRPGYGDFPNYFNTIIDSGSCVWPTARSHTNVFNVYDAAFYSDLSAAQQKSFIQYLIANKIQLGICINPLTKVPGTCADGEAYDNPANHSTAVTNLRTAISAATNGSNNWSPAYISLDSPGYGFEGSPQCLSIAVCAAQTAASIATFKAVWPNIKVVEYDGLSAFPQADVSAWFTAMRNAGQPIDGIADDFNWYTDWPSHLPTLASTCAASGVAYGLIYDGFCGVPGGDYTGDPNLSAQFALGMKINMQTLNASQSALPSKVVVATWGTPSTLTCPETTTTNLSALCNLALTSPYVLQAPPVALYTVWNYTVYCRYTSSYSQYQALISGTGGYYAAGVLGGLAQTTNPSSGISGLTPVYQYCNTSMSPNQYALSFSSTDSDLLSYSYTMQSSLGYAFPTSNGAALGGVPVYGAHKYVGPVNQYIYQNTPFPGQGNVFMQGFYTGTAVNVLNTTLSANTSGTLQQDVFNYTTSNITGHATSMLTGTWQTWYSGTTAKIATDSTKALFTAQNDQAAAWLPFTIQPNRIYTQTTTLQFTGTGSNWFGVGFNFNQGTSPWLLICPQSQAGQNSSACFNYSGNNWSNWVTIPASFYTAPIVVTVTWNTQTGVTQGFVNGVLEFTGTTPFLGGLDDTFNPNNNYKKRLNGGNPIGYTLPGFYHNGYGTYGPY